MRERILITLGSNIHPEQNIPAAIRALRRHPHITLVRVSHTYRSAAVGGSGEQPEFHNAAAEIEAAIEPAQLRRELRQIEAQLGRKRTSDKYAPRPIDLDIAMIGERVLEVDGHPIPDPEIARFPHLVLPLADIAPEWRHPILGISLRQIAAEMHYTDKEISKIMSSSPKTFQDNGHYASEAIFDAEFGEVYDPEFEALVTDMLVRLGEDPEREGLRRTPLRVAKALDFLTVGYTTSLEKVVNNAIFEDACSDMVVVKDIEFYSMCEHHMLPFFGKAHVAYIPNGKIIGLSKVARVVDMFARRLQVQERLTAQVADTLMEILEARGVAVVMEAGHLCMMMRGVQKQNSSTVTSAMRGSFREDARTRGEFLELVRN
ncbi:MAG: GTP cyclohydrolase I FolE [Caldilineales bacterium]|nr:GTP cyclohydrolase I FolE [Caldilineales bacterium]